LTCLAAQIATVSSLACFLLFVNSFHAVAAPANKTVPSTQLDQSRTRNPELLKAQTLMENAQFVEATKLVEQTIKSRKKSGKQIADCYEMLALINYYSGNLPAAALNAEKAGHLDPKDANIITTYAIILLSKKEIPAALKLAQTAISVDKKNARPHAVLAYCYQQLEQPDGGEMAKAVDLDPRGYDVNNLAVNYHIQRQELELALRAYDRLVKSHPNASQVYFKRGLFKRDKYAREGALADFRKALELNPKDSLARFHYAKLLFLMQRWKEALAEFNLYFENSGVPIPSIYARRAECYAHLGKSAEAIQDYNKAISLLSPRFKDDVFDGAILNINKERYKSSDYATNWMKRAEVFDANGQYDRALKDTEALLKYVPKDTNALYLRHRLYMKTGKYRQALLAVNKLIASDSDVARWYTQRAEVYEKLGRNADAARDLARAKQLRVSGKLEEE